MKKTIFTLLGAWFSFALLGQTSYTVSNDPDIPAQFSDLQAAIDAASSGDIIYIVGTETSYGSVDIRKQITLYGPGHNQTYNGTLHNDEIAQVGIIRLYEANSETGTAAADGSYFSGLRVQGIQVFDQNDDFQHDVDNITIRNCWLISTLNASQSDNWTIVNNVLTTLFVIRGEDSFGDIVNDATDFTIENNIFRGAQIELRGNNQSFVNNVVINSLFITFERAVCQNNIFYGGNVSDIRGENSTISHNLSFGTGNSFPANGVFGASATSSGLTITNNQENTDPQFVTTFSNTDSPQYDYSLDLNLQTGSPAMGAGVGGTDLGIFGGTYPYTDVPAIPHIRTLIINNASVSEGGTLNVTIQGVSGN